MRSILKSWFIGKIWLYTKLSFFSSHFSSEHLRKPREAVDASKKIIGDIQKINPDKDGVCTCPICPKGNLFINSLFLILF